MRPEDSSQSHFWASRKSLFMFTRQGLEGDWRNKVKGRPHTPPRTGNWALATGHWVPIFSSHPHCERHHRPSTPPRAIISTDLWQT